MHSTLSGRDLSLELLIILLIYDLLLVIRFKINRSQMNSITETSIADTVLNPNFSEVPSMISILFVDTIDDMIQSPASDFSNMCKQIMQVRRCFLNLDCHMAQCRNYGIRLLALINYTLKLYGIDNFYCSKIFGCIRSCANKWKNVLSNNLHFVNSNPRPQTVFLYKSERNTYLLSFIKTTNILLDHTLNKLLKQNLLTAKSKKYLKAKGFTVKYQRIIQKMLLILGQKQEEDYLKINLINQFLIYILHNVHFCTTEDEQNQAFQTFYLFAGYLVRILQKFYVKSMEKTIEQSLKIIRKGIDLYITIASQRGLKYGAKMQQMQYLLSLLDKRPTTLKQTPIIHENALIIRFLHKILFNCKREYRKCQSTIEAYEPTQTDEMLIAKYIQKGKEKKTAKFMLSKPSQFKLEVVKINKSLSQLNRRKSFSRKPEKNLTGLCLQKLALQLTENKKNQNRHKDKSISRPSSRVYSLSEFRSNSKDRRRRLLKPGVNGEEKQLKIEDYATFYSRNTKIVQTTNKIQLYKADKMTNYYRNRPKARLRLT